MTRLTQRFMSLTGGHRVRVVVAALAAVLFVGGSTVQAQSKKNAKQAENLMKAGENAKAAIGDALEHVGALLDGYNSIIDGTAKNAQSAYGKLVSDLKGTQKKIDGAHKSLESMNREAEKFFAAWEADVASISSDSLKEKSLGRMDAMKQSYANLGDTLGQAGDAFAPLLKNLNDQILYLGRDMSDAAIADLQDEAAALNAQAEEVTERVKALLGAGEVRASEPEPEARAEPEPATEEGEDEG